jgi:formylglycine-generating enzyme required for sulfatase activity
VGVGLVAAAAGCSTRSGNGECNPLVDPSCVPPVVDAEPECNPLVDPSCVPPVVDAEPECNPLVDPSCVPPVVDAEPECNPLVDPTCAITQCEEDGVTGCDASALVPGNAAGATLAGEVFYRSYDAATDDYNDMGYPATVSDFRLDVYEVTVGRFRAFVEAGYGTQAQPPAAGSGAHAAIAGSGWDSGWNASLATDTAGLKAALKCDDTFQTWTDTAGANEFRPINCVSWYEAMAFCTWDGGYLPTETEWQYAAGGGSEQRAYPWSVPASSTTISEANASYGCVGDGDGGADCTVADLIQPGSKPAGNGRWGHADLGGNVWEWTLDWYADPYINPCNNCANLMGSYGWIVGGGTFNLGASALRGARRSAYSLQNRNQYIGLRCARTP